MGDSDSEHESAMKVRCQSFLMEKKDLGFSDEEIMEHHISDCEDDDFVNLFKYEQEKAKSKQKKKKKSKRVRKIEDYFQWPSLKEKQKDTFYEFVRTCKKEWNNRGFEDDDVEKH